MDDNAPSTDRTFSAPQGWVLLATCGVALVLRALRWHLTPSIFSDGPTFIDLAKLISVGNWLGALLHDYHPLYPVMIAGVQPLVGDWEQTGAWISIASGNGIV